MPFEEAPFGVTGLETAFAALYTHLVEPGLAPARDAARADVAPGRRAIYGLERAADRGRRAGEPRPARPRARAGASSEDGFRSRSANSWLLGETLHGQGAADGRRRTGGVRGMTRLPRARGRDGLPRRVGRRAEGFAFGEAVFTTAMTGYQEVVTDPSYAEQIVCFTAPMVGNYGVADERSRVGRGRTRARS